MKKLYKVGSMLEIKATPKRFLKLFLKPKDMWCMYNSKLIFAENEEIAKKKYQKLYFDSFKCSIRKCLPGMSLIANYYSNNMCFSSMLTYNLSYKHYPDIIESNYECKNILTMINYMPASDFREWWYSIKNSKKSNKTK